MKMVAPYLVRGVLVPTLAALAACSGTQTNSGNPRGDEVGSQPTANAAERAGDPSATQDPTRTPQDPQQVDADRRRLVITKSIEEARRSLDQRMFQDAARTAAQVLDLEPGNEEARQILMTAQSLLGEQNPGTARAFQDLELGQDVARERDRFRVREAESRGDAELRSGRYGDAVESYRYALKILQMSVFTSPGTEYEQALQTKLRNAEQAKQRAENAADEANRAASRRQLQDEENKLRISREARVKRLLEEANFDFQVGNYDRAVTNLERALQDDATNAHALALRDLATRAQHETRLDLLRQDWKAEWSKTFDELKSMDVYQSETVKYDLDRWRYVDKRTPLTFTPPEDLESPEERAILDKLQTTVVPHRFAEATLEDWKSHYARITGINFVVTPQVRELDTEKTTLKDFVLPPRSVFSALETIGSVTGVRWKVQNGAVLLVTPENAHGQAYLVPYGVEDLVRGISDKPGRELKLRGPQDQEEPLPDDEEPKPTVVDANKLMDLIKEHVAKETWDTIGSITEQKGVLQVRTTREIHTKVEKLLADLREAVGIQVDIETRFLKVEDSFLEDIGVDFRGLGNQASEGVAGRGLEQNNRGNAGFDDFGRREQINPATPGAIGTGTEPGIFFDDGQDGDIMARTENLFDRTLGGEDRLTNAGGLAVQYAFLDDTEVEIVLRAVAKQERSEEITAPRLLVYNNARANMSVLRHTSYIRDFNVEIAQAAAIANPVVDVVKDGVVLDVRPVVSADRKFITMELRPSVMALRLPIPTFTTTLGVGQPVSIQLPSTTLQRVRTTVTMPDGGTMMLGGMKLAERQHQVSGVPILKDLPLVSFFFSRKGTFVLNRKILILIRAKIILKDEHKPTWLGDDFSSVLLGK